MGGIVLFTSLMNGFHYYTSLYFLKNVSIVMNSPGTIVYRDCSIESFLRATFLNLNLNLDVAKYTSYALKIGLIILTLWILNKIIKNRSFFQGEKRMEVIYNGYVVLIVLMTMLSPIVWVHHLVFLVFPFLIIFQRLTKIDEYFLFVVSYFVIFLMPTYNFYPFSYLRLLGVVLCYVLLYRFAWDMD